MTTPGRGFTPISDALDKGHAMGITLEWAHLPTGEYLRTICRDGIPPPDVTRYLLVAGASPVGSVNTPRAYAHALLPFHKWLESQGIRLPDVSVHDVMRFKQALRGPECKTSGLLLRGADSADSTRACVVNTTVRFLKWALGIRDTVPLRLGRDDRLPGEVRFGELRRTDAGALQRLRATRPKRHVPKHLTWDELNVCRAWIMDHFDYDEQLRVRNRAIFELLWDAALRRGSLLALRRDAINWMERIILATFDERDYQAAWFTKSPSGRTSKTGEYEVFISDQTLQWLDRYRREARPHVEAARFGHGLFFCRHAPGDRTHGMPLTVHALRHLFETMSKSVDEGGAGVRVTPHMLRHTWTAMAEDDGVPIEVRKSHLGHASILSTQQYGFTSSAATREILTEWRAKLSQRPGAWGWLDG